MKKILILLLALFLAPISFAETIQCKVVGVHDGDTITCLTDAKKQIKIRLWGIDAPESGQSFGQKSKQALSDMVFGRYVTIETKATDKYKRTVATIFTTGMCSCYPDGDPRNEYTDCGCKSDINLAMVRQGMAWWYKDYAKKSLTLSQAEQEARGSKRGLWSQPNPIPPWEWRKQKGMK